MANALKKLITSDAPKPEVTKPTSTVEFVQFVQASGPQAYSTLSCSARFVITHDAIGISVTDGTKGDTWTVPYANVSWFRKA